MKNNIRNIFDALLYKGIPKDKLRKILNMTDSRDSSLSLKAIKSVSGEQLNNTMFNSNSVNMKFQKSYASHQDSSSRLNNSRINNTKYSSKLHTGFPMSVDMYSSKKNSKILLESGDSPSRVNAGKETDNPKENSFCVIVTLRNHMNKLGNKNIVTRPTSCVSVTENIPQPLVDHCRQSSDKDTESLRPLNKDVILPLNSFVNTKRSEASTLNINSHKFYSHSESCLDSPNNVMSRKPSKVEFNALKNTVRNTFPNKLNNFKTDLENSTIYPVNNFKERVKISNILKQRESVKKLLNAAENNIDVDHNMDYIKQRFFKTPDKSEYSDKDMHLKVPNRYRKSLALHSSRNTTSFQGKKTDKKTKNSQSLYKQLQRVVYKNALTSKNESKKGVSGKQSLIKLPPLTYMELVKDYENVMANRIQDKTQYGLKENEDRTLKSYSEQETPKGFKEKNIYLTFKTPNTITKHESMTTEDLGFDYTSPEGKLHTSLRKTNLNRMKNRQENRGRSYEIDSSSKNNDFVIDKYIPVNNVFSNKLTFNKQDLKSEVKRIAQLSKSFSDMRLKKKYHKLSDSHFNRYDKTYTEYKKVNSDLNIPFQNSWLQKSNKISFSMKGTLKNANKRDTLFSIPPKINVANKNHDKISLADSFSTIYSKIEKTDHKKVKYCRGIY